MPINKLASEASFAPEEVACLTAAYEAALQQLRLIDRNDPVTQIVAKKIIEIGRAGELDPPRVCARALQELGIALPEQPRS